MFQWLANAGVFKPMRLAGILLLANGLLFVGLAGPLDAVGGGGCDPQEDPLCQYECQLCVENGIFEECCSAEDLCNPFFGECCSPQGDECGSAN